jgi:hypothetical protein
MTIRSWILRSMIAGFAGSIVHFLFMYIKSRAGLLPEFQPYQAFQAALNHWIGTNVPAIVPWALSFLNGMAILGFVFARIDRLLPGRTGAGKGVTFGCIGWVFMNLIFFPLIGLGPFAIRVTAGISPALLSFVMLQTYSIVLGAVYAALDARARSDALAPRGS